ncbi:MAG: hypothetical protein Ta2B_26010 [Termitinemataceae bacterium]|nr:MAG: hypothetical protein Ta2B_26010 [Termitinemataceae bacterium]
MKNLAKTGWDVILLKCNESSKSILILAATVLVASLLWTACEQSDAVGVITNPTIEKGVYVNFSGEGGTPASQIFNLVYEEIPVITFHEHYADEAAFFAARGLTSYDYVADPDGYGALTTPDFTITGTNLLYTIDEIKKLSLPDLSSKGYKFINWAIKTVDTTRLGDILTVDTEVENPALFSFLIDKNRGGKLATKTSGQSYITFKAQYIVDPKLGEKIGGLQGIVEETLAVGNTKDSTYEDEFLLGGGTLVDDPSRMEKYGELQQAIGQANSLLEGKLETVETVLDMYEMDAEGNIKDPPVPIKEISSYIAYDVPAIEAMRTKLAGFKANPDYHFVNFAPKSAVIPADKKMHSVTITEDGIYEIELYGGSGGHIWTASGNTTFGGKGGHVKGQVRLTAGSVLKFTVGTAGEGKAMYDPDRKIFIQIPDNPGEGGWGKAAGWPNGGKGGDGYNRGFVGAAGGGGSTNVYVLGTNAADRQKGDLSRDKVKPALTERIAVAGGGGGAAQVADIGGNYTTFASLRGGNAGERAIRRGDSATSNSNNQFLFTVVTQDKKTWYYGVYYDGTLNANGNGSNGTNVPQMNGAEGRGGGGGGYAGGISPPGSGGYPNTGSGGGGTNYLNGLFINPAPFVLNTEKNDNGIADYYGDGKATIKYVRSN